MSTRLLRAAVSDSDVGLSRVTAVVSDDPALEDVLVGAFSRFVLVGVDGVRLHEEVIHAGGWAPDNGRFRRLENLSVLGGHLGRALAAGAPASPPVQARLAARWPRIVDGVLASIDWRANTREQSLERRLAERVDEERNRILDGFAQFMSALSDALADDDADTEQTLLSLAEVTKSREELEQYRRDRRAWSERLQRLDDERDRELTAVAARYADPTPHRFPVAVVFVVPKREATR